MYDYSLTPEGFYLFTTDAGIEYYARFFACTNRLSPVLGVYDVEIYEFDFFRKFPTGFSLKDKKDDSRVQKTVMDILKSGFVHDRVVVVAVCDSSDGKEKARQKLFEKWHKEDLIDTLEQIPLEVEINEEKRVYGSIYIPHGFPYRDVLDRELVDNSYGIITEKYGD